METKVVRGIFKTSHSLLRGDLLKNAEVEGAREFCSESIICDAKVKNLEIMHFLLKHHYKIAGRNDLYGLNSGEDLVYKKYAAGTELKFM